MAGPNIEVTRRWIDAYNRRAIAEVLALSDEEIEFRSRFAAIESGGVFRGHAGVEEYFRAIDDAYERFQVVVHEFIDAGAAVVLDAEAEWRGRGSGAAGRTPIAPVVWMRDGKILRAETFADRGRALEAVGLE